MESFLVPESSLGRVVHCPQDGCAVRLPQPPFRESPTLRRFEETDWLRASDLHILLTYATWRMSPRQQRLFAAACCRRAWHLFADERAREAVRAAEDYADGVIRMGLLSAAAMALGAAVRPVRWDFRVSLPRDAHDFAAAAARGVVALRMKPGSVAADVRNALAYSLGRHSGPDDPERAAQAALIREFLGNPFRPVALDPAWLAWNDSTVPKLARAVYDERAFDRLPILADALEEAGCDNADILAHCRGPGPHVRGCWVVDALMIPARSARDISGKHR